MENLEYIRLINLLLILTVIFFLEGFFPHFKGRFNRYKHAVPNLVLGGINGIFYSFLFAGLTILIINWSNTNPFGILNFEGIPLSIKGIFAFLLFDLWMYLWHRANHRITFLWRFHRVHHTDPDMDATTAIRFHPIEIILSSFFRLAVITIIGMDFIHLFIYEISMQPIILFHHSNIGLPEKQDRLLRSLIVTPNMHRVHHSQEGFDFNSNFASIFSFWDRLFGTFKREKDTIVIKLGLKILKGEKWQKLWGLLITPFK